MFGLHLPPAFRHRPDQFTKGRLLRHCAPLHDFVQLSSDTWEYLTAALSGQPKLLYLELVQYCQSRTTRLLWMVGCAAPVDYTPTFRACLSEAWYKWRLRRLWRETVFQARIRPLHFSACCCNLNTIGEQAKSSRVSVLMSQDQREVKGSLIKLMVM